MKQQICRTVRTIQEDGKINLLNIIVQETTFKKIAFSAAIK